MMLARALRYVRSTNASLHMINLFESFSKHSLRCTDTIFVRKKHSEEEEKTQKQIGPRNGRIEIHTHMYSIDRYCIIYIHSRRIYV